MNEVENPASKLTKYWYEQQFVKFEMVKQLQNKFLSIMTKRDEEKRGILMRYLLGYKVEVLDNVLKKYNVYNLNTKLYFDLATYSKDKPFISYNMEERQEQKKKFNEEIIKYIVGYDFALDIDSDKKIMDAWKVANKIKKLFDEFKLPYSLRFSGNGFHFYIPYNFFNQKIKIPNLVKNFGIIAVNMAETLNIPRTDKESSYGLDCSIFDIRRIIKLCYSISNEKVVLPLDDNQWNNFNIDDMKIDKILSNIKIFKRGTLIRSYDLTEKELIKNTQKFFREYK